MFNIVRKEFQFGQHQVVLETGRVARQANTVLITMGGVTVLVAVVAKIAVDLERIVLSFAADQTDWNERNLAVVGILVKGLDPSRAVVEIG